DNPARTVIYSTQEVVNMSLIINGKRHVYHIDEACTFTHSDGKQHYRPRIAVEHTAGYNDTDYDYGTDFAIAKKCVDELNARAGISKAEQAYVVTTSMFPGSRATLEDFEA